MQGPELLATWLREFAQEQSEAGCVQAFVDTVDNSIRSQMPIFDTDPVLTEDLHRSTRYQWLAFLSVLQQREHQILLPPQAHDLARTLARRGHELGVLLKVYRSAHNGVFEYCTAVVESLDDQAPPREEVLKHLWNRVDRWLNDAIEVLIETFYEERQERHEGALARRAEVVETLLAGDPISVDEATDVLGHPLLQWQLGCVLWASEAGADSAAAVLQTANDLAKSLGAARPLFRVAGSRDMWVWVATPAQPDLTAIRHLEPRLAELKVHLSLGVPAPGVEGFRSSHAEARAAQNLCMTVATSPTIVDYRAVELLCLAATSGVLMERMVRREIGALRGVDKNLAQLRQTTLAFFTNQMNIEATAAKLFVHKNTVRYRLARAEELLGHPLVERTALVELALRYVEFFDPSGNL
ncbi:PucR family transcriptional regulator [Nocardia sp. FBN12]|uniref:PucR family transcriptional regulator n=1 Tax=Nocardia sp. FBN12 TaxID=3419766 RepID=UPI003D039D35